MNICIIGLGWLGEPLAESLLKGGHSIYGSTRSVKKQFEFQNRGIHTFIFDLEQSEKIPLKDIVSIDLLIITIPPLKRETPDYYGEKLVEIASSFPSTTKIIFTSSTSVYSKASGIYGELSTKLVVTSSVFKAESALTKLLKSRLTVLRLGGLVGVNRHPVNSIQGKQNIKNPCGIINFVHQNDVIRAIHKIIQEDNFGEIYNLVNPHHPTREEFYTDLIEKNGLLPIEFDNSSDIIRRKINSSKIINALDFTFTSPINTLNK